MRGNCLQAIDEPRIQCVGYKFIDSSVAKTEDCKGRPFGPVVNLQAHENSVLPWPNVHVPHVECPQAVEDCAHSDHPAHQQRHSPSLVVEEEFDQAHGCREHAYPMLN